MPSSGQGPGVPGHTHDERLEDHRVEAIYLRLPQVKTQCDSGQDALIVKVTTDAGIVGYGEVDSNPIAVKGCIEGPFSHTTATGLAHVLIGEDPFRTEYLWHKMYRANIYGGRRGIGIHAMSGIDLALWDIKGKALGSAVWKLLGGGFTRSLRAYASSLFGATPAETGDRHGGSSIKASRPSSSAGTRWERHAETDVALVREARAGSARTLDLMIDAGLVSTPRPPFSAPGIRAVQPVLVRGALSARRLRGLCETGREQPATDRRRRGRERAEVVPPAHGRRPDRHRADRPDALRRFHGSHEDRRLAADRGLPVVNHGFTTYLNVAAGAPLPGERSEYPRLARIRRRGGDDPPAVHHRGHPSPGRPGRRTRFAGLGIGLSAEGIETFRIG